MKYKKKPVEVEAIQWVEGNARRPIIDFTNYLVRMDEIEKLYYVYDRLHDTWVKFKDGDWIIKGVQGEFYPCDAEIFEATYEEVKYDNDISGPDDLGKVRLA